jgi:hypothetical protein
MKPALGLSEIIVNDKMDAVIDSIISKTDTNFSNYLKLVAITNYSDIEQKYPPGYLSMKRNEWWMQQYTNAAAVFYNDKYKIIWEDYLKSK